MKGTVNINPNNLYTKSRYSKEFGISRPTIDKMIKEDKLTVIRVKGGVLIVNN